MKIREIQTEDYPQIRELHIKYNLKILDKVEWINFWSRNPCIQDSNDSLPLGWILEENKRIVGYLGNIPKEYYYKNKKFTVACSHAWVAEDKYRLHAFSLLETFFSQKNIDVYIITTANNISEKVLTRYNAKKIPLENFQNPMFIILNLEKLISSYLKYKKIKLGKFIVKLLYYPAYIFYYKKLNFWKKTKQSKKVILNEIIDTKFDDFWESYKLNFQNKLLQNRNATWLNWHIKEKIKNDKAWIMSVIENNKILGYAICSERNNEKIELHRIEIIDLVALDDNQEVYYSLIKNCILETKKRGYHIFEMTGFKHLKRKIFSEFKIIKRKLPTFPFYYKTSNVYYKNFLENSEMWDPSLIDGDAFL